MVSKLNKAKAISAKLLELNLKVQLALFGWHFLALLVCTSCAFWLAIFGAFWLALIGAFWLALFKALALLADAFYKLICPYGSNQAGG